MDREGRNRNAHCDAPYVVCVPFDLDNISAKICFTTLHTRRTLDNPLALARVVRQLHETATVAAAVSMVATVGLTAVTAGSRFDRFGSMRTLIVNVWAAPIIVLAT